MPETSNRRDELLDAAVEHVIEHGFEHLSIRTLAAGLRVAPNSLTYHFGSRADLVTAIFKRLSERSRTAAFAPDLDASPSEILRLVWQEMTAPENRRFWQTFFEFSGVAFREPERHAEFLEHVSQAWLQPIASNAMAAGLEEPEALAAATMIVATMRGLMLDLLAGGDRARLDHAVELLAGILELSRPPVIDGPDGSAKTA